MNKYDIKMFICCVFIVVDPNQVLFTAHDTGIKYISLDIEDEFVDIIFPVFAKNVNNVNFGIGHMIYWTEASTELSQTNSSAIRRSELNGSNMQTLVQFGLHTPRGLVIDNAGGNLYWVDGYFKRIEVSRLNGSSRRLLIDSDLTDPHSLAIDKSSRYKVTHTYITVVEISLYSLGAFCTGVTGEITMMFRLT